MSRIYLLRHASPQIEPGTAARNWHLSARGVEEARRLADIAAGWGISALYSSAEPKAAAMASIIGDALGLAVHLVEGFEEQHWDQWVDNADAFNDVVRQILERPDQSVHGSEPAGAAADRFEAALRIAASGALPAAVVSHGRVLTAWMAQTLGLESPFETWRAMPMPAYACVELPPAGGMRLVDGFGGLSSADE